MSDSQTPAPIDPALEPVVVPDEPLPSSRRKVVLTIIVVAVVAFVAIIGVVIALTLFGQKPAPVAGDGGETPAAEQPVDEIDGVSYENGPYAYSVVFPDTPVEQSQTLPVQGNEIELAVAYWQDGEQVLAANAARFPAEMLGDVDTMLQGSLAGAVGNVPGAELVSSEATTLDGIPAIAGHAMSPAGDLRAVIAFDDDVQYQLIAVGVDEETAEAFFASFQKS